MPNSANNKMFWKYFLLLESGVLRGEPGPGSLSEAVLSPLHRSKGWSRTSLFPVIIRQIVANV